ncbi:MAG: hypothetical protein A2563_01595 [Candidatus Magasanikbacteria bacterium RIFOXYD1_FULL_40_23]|uniref:YARHG domain-containing protein n=1 Tax=Candidatus Magasanikbacteria bacterium RIFOXYD1_FULL_40_23 TaxID=1798705 RepID=A0A1F6PB56_9BACT|nr:MAG: hypothetical protein A2563_01595 [Candidatus Magasanikbacteria bacterium RIFOXYD1_FULL_40_23]
MVKILIAMCIALGMLLPNVGTAYADTPPSGTYDYDTCKKLKQRYTLAESQLQYPKLTCRYIGGTTSQACRDKLVELEAEYYEALRRWRFGNCAWWDANPPTTSVELFDFEWYLSVMDMDLYTLEAIYPSMDIPLIWP